MVAFEFHLDPITRIDNLVRPYGVELLFRIRTSVTRNVLPLFSKKLSIMRRIRRYMYVAYTSGQKDSML